MFTGMFLPAQLKDKVTCTEWDQCSCDHNSFTTKFEWSSLSDDVQLAYFCWLSWRSRFYLGVKGHMLLFYVPSTSLALLEGFWNSLPQMFTISRCNTYFIQTSCNIFFCIKKHPSLWSILGFTLFLLKLSSNFAFVRMKFWSEVRFVNSSRNIANTLDRNRSTIILNT